MVTSESAGRCAVPVQGSGVEWPRTRLEGRGESGCSAQSAWESWPDPPQSEVRDTASVVCQAETGKLSIDSQDSQTALRQAGMEL